MSEVSEEKELTVEQQIAKLSYEIQVRHSNLEWFDYQVRGGRWADRPSNEVDAERQEIINDIQSMNAAYNKLTMGLRDSKEEVEDD